MFKSISWSAYFSFIGFLTIIYYSYVVPKFYGRALLKIIKQKYPGVNAQAALQQSFADEVLGLVREAGKETTKEHLLESLAAIAARYPAIAESNKLTTIHSTIVRQAAVNCAVPLSEEDVMGIWTRA